MTFYVTFVVILVNVYMLGICHVWGLTINNYFTINMSFALGIAVDYSVHIGHTYLCIKPPAGV